MKPVRALCPTSYIMITGSQDVFGNTAICKEYDVVGNTAICTEYSMQSKTTVRPLQLRYTVQS